MKPILNNKLFFITVAVLIALFVAIFSPFLGIAISFGFLVLYFSLKNPLNGILFLAFYLPFEPLILKFISGPVASYAKIASDALIVFLFLYTIIIYLVGHKKFIWQRNTLNWLIIFFVIIWLVSTIYNQVDLVSAFSSLRQLFRYALIFYVLFYLGADEKFVKKFIYVCFSVLILESFIGLSQLILPASFSYFLTPATTQTAYGSAVIETGNFGWNITERIAGTFGRYDRFGIFLSFFLVIGLGLYYILKKQNKTNLLPPILAFGSLALIFTFSRLSWSGVLLGLILIGWLWQKDKRIKFGILAGLSILIIYLSIFLALTGFKISSYEENPAKINFATRVLQTFSYYEWENSYYGFGRIFFWINTPKIVVASSPLIGVGPGLYGSGTASALQNREVYNRLGLPFGIQDQMGQIDNNWFSIWGEYGTLGFLIFLAFFISLFFQTKKKYLNNNTNLLVKGLALGFMALCIIYPLQSFFGPYFEIRTISFYFWAVAGIIISYKK